MNGIRWLILLGLGLLTACAPTGVAVEEPTALPTEPAAPPVEPPSLGGRVADFPQPIIVYRHEGRTADESRQWTIYPTGLIIGDDGSQRQAPAEAVAPLFDYFTSAAFWASDAPDTSTSSPGAAVRRVIVYYQGEIHEIVVPPGAAPDAEDWRPMVDALEQLVTGRP